MNRVKTTNFIVNYSLITTVLYIYTRVFFLCSAEMKLSKKKCLILIFLKVISIKLIVFSF